MQKSETQHLQQRSCSRTLRQGWTHLSQRTAVHSRDDVDDHVCLFPGGGGKLPPPQKSKINVQLCFSLRQMGLKKPSFHQQNRTFKKRSSVTLRFKGHHPLFDNCCTRWFLQTLGALLFRLGLQCAVCFKPRTAAKAIRLPTPNHNRTMHHTPTHLCKGAGATVV